MVAGYWYWLCTIYHLLISPLNLFKHCGGWVNSDHCASSGAAIVREPEDDRVVIQTRVLSRELPEANTTSNSPWEIAWYCQQHHPWPWPCPSMSSCVHPSNIMTMLSCQVCNSDLDVLVLVSVTLRHLQNNIISGYNNTISGTSRGPCTAWKGTYRNNGLSWSCSLKSVCNIKRHIKPGYLIIFLALSWMRKVE